MNKFQYFKLIVFLGAIVVIILPDLGKTQTGNYTVDGRNNVIGSDLGSKGLLVTLPAGTYTFKLTGSNFKENYSNPNPQQHVVVTSNSNFGNNRTFTLNGVGDTKTITTPGAPIWLLFIDTITSDNVGSSTVEITSSSAPQPPINVNATDGTYTDKVKVTWNSSSGASHYRVYRNTSSNSGNATSLGNWQSGTTYYDYSATPGKTYYYWVKAATSSSGSNASDFSSYNTGWRKLSPPTNVSASDGTYTDEVRVTWNSSSGASYYRVYRNTNSSSSGATALGSWQSSTTYHDYSATQGQTYYYWVKAATSNTGSRPSDYSSYDTGYPLSANYPPINSLAPDQASPGEEFWVDINVGSSSIPVTDLKIVSFELHYTNTSIVDFVTYEIGHFLTNAQANVISDEPNGKVSTSVYRTTGGNSGHGVVIRLKFKILNSATEGQTACFNIDAVQANSSYGATINLSPSGPSCLEIRTGLSVWPGDANNDGLVSIFDINSIVAIYWEKTGPQRPNASNQWSAQQCPPWNPEGATYADCNGDGMVNIFDINSVIINFGKTHPLLSLLTGIAVSSGENTLKAQTIQQFLDKIRLTDPPITIEARDYDNVSQEFWLDIIIGSSNQPVVDIKVVSFELTYTNTANIDYVSYEIGTFLSQAQATVIANDTNGKISASIYRTTGGNSGYGVLISLKFKASVGHNVDFNFAGVMANKSDGSIFYLAPEGKTIITSVQEFSNIKPNEFALFPNYPNPFNPKTEIRFQIPKSSQIILTVFNTVGQKIRTLANGKFSEGSHSIRWNGKDDFGNDVSGGLYLCRMVTENYQKTIRMLLLK